MVQKKFIQFSANEQDAERMHIEDEHPFRSKFERDRDRILYSKEFRRLSGKTQVFVTSFDDHVRTRLTHTLEVSQISRTISLQLGLNEILTEAIALSHDIGHTPFGHCGERTLNHIMNGCDKIKIFGNVPNGERGFKHNWQGIRVVNDLEQISSKFCGLNLTNYTLWGILNHTGISSKECDYKDENGKCNLRIDNKNCSCNNISFDFYERRYKLPLNSWTFEAIVVRVADEIAQIHHDIEDSLENQIFNKEEILELFDSLFHNYLTEDDKKNLGKIKKETEQNMYIPLISKLIVNFLVSKLVENIQENFKRIEEKYYVKEYEDMKEFRKTLESKEQGLINYFKIINYDEDLKKIVKEFNNVSKSRILDSYVAQIMDGKSNYILRCLIKAYLINPQQLHDRTIISFYKSYIGQEEFFDKYYNKMNSQIVYQLRANLKEDHYKKCDSKYKDCLLRTICDYISGMTDNYALEQFRLLYGNDHIGKGIF